jgi:hypothetical protein
MKKLIGVLVMVLFQATRAYAATGANLEIKVYPLNSGKVNHIFMVNSANFEMYHQALPASCNVTVKDNQTLVVTGKVATRSDNSKYISGFNCKVS